MTRTIIILLAVVQVMALVRPIAGLLSFVATRRACEQQRQSILAAIAAASA